MELQQYIDYILEARKRGFRDDVIKQSLIEKNWPESEIVKAFYRIDGEADRTKELGEEKEAPKKESKQTNKELKKEIKKPVEKQVKKPSIDTENKIKQEIQEHQQLNKDLQDLELDAEINLRNNRSIILFLDEELREALEKRAKKNMFTLPEQIEDILRRSALNQKLKRTLPEDKLDDKLVGLFSRKNTGPKAKSKNKKIKKKTERKSKRKGKKK